jgi:phosphatidylglycerophosphate synthase
LSGPISVVLLVDHAFLLSERLAGMLVIERHLFTLWDAGIRRIRVCWTPPASLPLRIPEGMEVLWRDRMENQVPTPYLAVSSDHLLRASALRTILADFPPRSMVWTDEEGRAVLQAVPSSSDQAPSYLRRPLPAGAGILLRMPMGSGPVWSWLTKDAVKSRDSFLARNFDRRLSLSLTRLLVDTALTPNQMTLLSTAVGLCGTTFMLPGSRQATLAGALLVWLHTVLDGCDGELARLRHAQSRLGGILDFWGDNLVHASLFICLGIGIYLSMGHALALFSGIAAALGAMIAACDVYRHMGMRSTVRDPLFNGLEGLTDAPETPTALRRLAAVEDMLSRRDFIYLLVLLAFADYPEVFLWAAGIGSPLFAGILLYLRNQQKRATSPAQHAIIL